MVVKKVYIASPYTQGDKLQMVRIQIDAWHALQDLGYYAIPPLLSHYINEVRERIAMCDAVVRIRPKDERGIEIPSSGADKEKIEAQRLGLQYREFETIEQMRDSLQEKPL